MSKISDRQTLISAAIVHSHRTDLSIYMDQFLGEAEDKITTTVKSIYNQSETIIANVAGEYAMPADYIEAIYLILGTTPVQMDSVRMRAYNQTEHPIASFHNRVITIQPDPGATSLEVGYFAVPTVLVADSDTNDLLTNEPLTYLYALMGSVTTFMEQTDMMQMWDAKYLAEVERINGIAIGSHPAGGPLNVRGIQ